MATQKIVCILNGSANSQKAAASCNEVATYFASKGNAANVHIAKNGSELSRLAKTAVAQGATTVVAGGGDGTISAVAAELVRTEAALGVIPMGTLNHFAKDMGVPLDIHQAMENVISGVSVRIDVGTVGGHTFLNNASVGIYPKLVAHRENLQANGMAKWIAIVPAALRVLRFYAPQRITIESDVKGRIVDKVPFVFIGNNEYESSGLEIGKRSRLNAGRLWVYRGSAATRLEIALLAAKSLAGCPAARELEIFSTENFTLRTKHARPRVAIDGEVLVLDSPLEFRSLKAALSVVVPHPTLSANT